MEDSDGECKQEGLEFKKTEKTRLRRLRDRGTHSVEEVVATLKDGLLAHVGTVRWTRDEMPYPVVIPMLYGYEVVVEGDLIVYLHGSVSMGTAKAAPAPICITVTLVDAIVVAKSLFNSSANYRSVVIHGTPVVVEDELEKMHGFQLITAQSIHAQRWHEARLPNEFEMKQTVLLRVTVESATCKRREGPPHDDDTDHALPVWSGLVPRAGAPIQDEHSVGPAPSYLSELHKKIW